MALANMHPDRTAHYVTCGHRRIDKEVAHRVFGCARRLYPAPGHGRGPAAATEELPFLAAERDPQPKAKPSVGVMPRRPGDAPLISLGTRGGSCRAPAIARTSPPSSFRS